MFKIQIKTFISTSGCKRINRCILILSLSRRIRFSSFFEINVRFTKGGARIKKGRGKECPNLNFNYSKT